jgi:integrase
MADLKTAALTATGPTLTRTFGDWLRTFRAVHGSVGTPCPRDRGFDLRSTDASRGERKMITGKKSIERLMTLPELSEMLRIPIETLYGWRHRGEGTGRRVDPSITFHGLRHSFVAILVAAGCNVREVSERAGHNSVAFTLTRYGGLFEDGSEAAVDRLDALLRGGSKDSDNVLQLDMRKLR